MDSMLDKLEFERIVRFVPSVDKKIMSIEEQCDQCFIAYLTKEDMQLLIEELQELYDEMV